MRDPYEVLGVAKSADPAEIKKAFRKLAKEYHPDTHPGDQKIAEKFKDISAAHQLLSNAEKRGEYDRGEINADGSPRAPQFRTRENTGGHPFGYEFTNAGGPAGAQSDDFLSEFFSGIRGAGRRAFRARGEDVRYTLAVSFIDAAKGTKERLKLPNSKTLDVNIPAGMSDGQQIRLRGQGAPGVGGGEAGDALIAVTVRPHPLFERDGNDIRMNLPISLSEAVLGGKIEVPTIDGSVTMTVRKGANSGDKLRLKGKGIPLGRGKGRGDQFVRLEVRLPDPPDDALREFVENWQAGQSFDARRGMKVS